MHNIEYIYIDNHMFYTAHEMLGMYPFFCRFFHRTDLHGAGYWLLDKIRIYLGDEAPMLDESVSLEVFERLLELGRERGDA